jgi:hypothetical protein
VTPKLLGDRRGWRLVVLVCFLLLVIPPSIAYGWTRYRYAQGTFGVDSQILAHTSGFLDRQYNAAYRAAECGAAAVWAVSYRKSPGNFSDITWLERSNCSPTQIGLTTGPRQAWCQQDGPPFGGPYAYNCDTTIP